MSTRKVVVESRKKANIGISIPELRLRKEWAKKGAKVDIDFDTLREALYDKGIEYMFTQGLLYITNMQDKIDLGLEPEEAKEPENILDMNEAFMKRMMKFMPIAEFEENFKKVTREQAIDLANFAIENEFLDTEKSDLIKEKTDIDILKSIALNRADKEPVKIME